VRSAGSYDTTPTAPNLDCIHRGGPPTPTARPPTGVTGGAAAIAAGSPSPASSVVSSDLRFGDRLSSPTPRGRIFCGLARPGGSTHRAAGPGRRDRRG
jgi:hypothetical protein